jgi:stearoyl-CoA desaturase (delta-9 desaturase)
MATIEAGAAERLPPPASSMPRRVDRKYASWVVGYHLIALLAFMPWFFSWTGVIVCAIGFLLYGLLGINIAYHRLLAHHSFQCPKWLEYTLAVIGVLCLQDTPARWVAVHRRHHEHSDDEYDPHSPLVSFFWAHMEWLLVENRDLARLRIFDRYAKDILRDRFYKRLERQYLHLWIIVGHWAVYFLGGFLAEIALGGSVASAIQFGLSLLVWGVFVRTVLVWHQTWSVNSMAHLWGYRNYATDDRSRNNLLVGIWCYGEGWHNNHHADPRSAKHGHRANEFDLTYWVIRLFERMGLAWRVAMPSPKLLAGAGSGELKTREIPQDYDE